MWGDLKYYLTHLTWRRIGYLMERSFLWILRALTLLCLGFLFISAFGKIDQRPDYRLAIPSILLLLTVAFWEYVWQLLKDRSLAVGKEGLSLGSPVSPSPPDGNGTVRDNFIFLGNSYFSRNDFIAAYEFYAAADRINSSILTSFRCAQCIAKGKLNADNILLQWYDKALWHADGPWKDLKDREIFAEWVRNLRAKRCKSSFASELQSELESVDF